MYTTAIRRIRGPHSYVIRNVALLAGDGKVMTFHFCPVAHVPGDMSLIDICTESVPATRASCCQCH